MRSAVVLDIDRVETPVGAMLVLARAGRLCALDFSAARQRLWHLLGRRFGPLEVNKVVDPHGLCTRVRAYFAGDLRALERIPLDSGGTDFQQRVWSALRTIAPGSTTSYAAVAARIGAPRAARAVGAACARNPILLAVPCHRVLGAAGRPVDYAGGLAVQRWLLRHEGVALADEDVATRRDILRPRLPRRSPLCG